jgi:pyrophosphatase PpaX
MNNINTLLFDVDGTILDTGEFIIQATEHALSTLGYAVPGRSMIASNVGKAFPDFYHSLSGSKKDIDVLIETHRDFQYKNYDLVAPFPGAVETLKELKRNGYKIAAITTRSKKTAHQTLINAGMYDIFDTIICGEDATELKPNPAPLFRALELMERIPENSVMIGDSHLDIEAGKNAGTKTIRVMYGFHTDNLKNPEPDFYINDIADLLKLL